VKQMFYKFFNVCRTPWLAATHSPHVYFQHVRFR